MKKRVFAILDRTVILLLLPALILSVTGAVLLPITGSEGYYQRQYEANGTLETLTNPVYGDYTKEELTEMTRAVIGYLLGGRESMQVTVERDGVVYEVFSVQALRHMADVKDLYTGGVKLEIGAVALLILCVAYFFWRREYVLKKWAATTGIAAVGIAIFMLGIGAYLIFNWENAFVQFHRLIFPDPAKFADAFFSANSNYPEKGYIDNLLLVKILTADLFRNAGLICAGVLATVLGIYAFLARKSGKKKTSC